MWGLINPCNINWTLSSRSWGIDPSLSTSLARKWRSLQSPLVHWVLWVSVRKHSIVQSQGCYNCPGSIIWQSASHKSFWPLRRYFVLKFSNGQLSPKSALTDQNFEIIYLQNGCSDWACKHIPKKFYGTIYGYSGANCLRRARKSVLKFRLPSKKVRRGQICPLLTTAARRGLIK